MKRRRVAHPPPPDDVSIARRLTDFFLQTRQIAEVEAQLDAILKRKRESLKMPKQSLGPGGRSP